MRDIISGEQGGSGLRVAVICSRFNGIVTERLLEGALRALEDAGVAPEQVSCYSVPGAVEIPVLARQLTLQQEVDAVVALGAVIRGETNHYEYVCSMAADGCQRVALDSGIPVAFGVLTCETGNQALARAGDAQDNKGYGAAQTAVEMADLLRKTRSR